jgi:hypothetical protein
MYSDRATLLLFIKPIGRIIDSDLNILFGLDGRAIDSAGIGAAAINLLTTYPPLDGAVGTTSLNLNVSCIDSIANAITVSILTHIISSIGRFARTIYRYLDIRIIHHALSASLGQRQSGQSAYSCDGEQTDR